MYNLKIQIQLPYYEVPNSDFVYCRPFWHFFYLNESEKDGTIRTSYFQFRSSPSGALKRSTNQNVFLRRPHSRVRPSYLLFTLTWVPTVLTGINLNSHNKIHNYTCRFISDLYSTNNLIFGWQSKFNLMSITLELNAFWCLRYDVSSNIVIFY